MPQSKKSGPLPPEQASAAYAGALHARLHCGSGWRADAFNVLRREYAGFKRAAARNEFCVLSMWEYARLVEATGGYLRYKRSGNFSDWFRMQVPANLKEIHALMHGVPFNDTEEESMCEALRRIMADMRSWRVQEKARE
jgi:hypothetical protein